MNVYKLLKSDFHLFVQTLRKFGTIWAPVQQPVSVPGSKPSFIFKKNPTDDEIVMEYTRTEIPPKQVINPPVIPLYKFDGSKLVDLSETITEKQVILGVHPCDIYGLKVVTQFYTTPIADPYVAKRRANTIIIGVSCMPDEFCFCRSTDTDVARSEDFDIFLNDLDDYYLLWVGSSAGDDIVRSCSAVQRETVTSEDIRKYIEWRNERNKQFKVELEFGSLADLMELEYNNEKIWEVFAERCLSCGTCTMVCPTCTCYDVKDVIDYQKGKGYRERRWDSCMYSDFSIVAGGHNFRAKKSDRLKLWYTHKLRAFVGRYGKPSCVGCGRCVVSCPVDINVLSVAQALFAEHTATDYQTTKVMTQ